VDRKAVELGQGRGGDIFLVTLTKILRMRQTKTSKLGKRMIKAARERIR